MYTLDKSIIYIAYIFIIFTIIASSGSIVLLSCKMQKFINNNNIIKNIINFLMIFGFVMMEGLNEDTSWSNTNPFNAFYISLLIYIIFVLFSKIQLEYAIFVMILLFILYVITTYKNNLKLNNKLSTNIENYINNFTYITFIFLIIISITGFIKYFIYKKNKHKDKFSIKHFFFGINKCNM